MTWFNDILIKQYAQLYSTQTYCHAMRETWSLTRVTSVQHACAQHEDQHYVPLRSHRLLPLFISACGRACRRMYGRVCAGVSKSHII